ncbi:hypothetical protein [Crateriforma conspicua]|uniref:hypothetical protein n=1 Tax=Crateriforma conspicua TaxID=2527996 RepID=UPI001E44BEFA|nr:hypothetical protein [Crateriforma conspicua]
MTFGWQNVVSRSAFGWTSKTVRARNPDVAEQSDAHGAADRAVCQWRAYSGGPVIAAVPRLRCMADVDPYQPPCSVKTAIDPTPPNVSRFPAIAPFLFVMLPMLFGVAGFAGYIVLAITLERQPAENEPVLSHGQQAMLISLPICTMIAASTGLALAFAFARQHALSIILLFAISLLGWLVTRSLWNAQIAQYGHDASEVVLYYPPAGYAAATACLAVLFSVFVILRSIKRGEPSVATEAASRRF